MATGELSSASPAFALFMGRTDAIENCFLRKRDAKDFLSWLMDQAEISQQTGLPLIVCYGPMVWKRAGPKRFPEYEVHARVTFREGDVLHTDYAVGLIVTSRVRCSTRQKTEDGARRRAVSAFRAG